MLLFWRQQFFSLSKRRNGSTRLDLSFGEAFSPPSPLGLIPPETDTSLALLLRSPPTLFPNPHRSYREALHQIPAIKRVEARQNETLVRSLSHFLYLGSGLLPSGAPLLLNPPSA